MFFLSTLCTEWHIILCSLPFRYKCFESYYTTLTDHPKKVTLTIKSSTNTAGYINVLKGIGDVKRTPSQ